MSLLSRNVLLYTDDSNLMDFMSITLKPLVKNLVVAKDTNEALKKIENQIFDCVVFRTKSKTLDDMGGPYSWTLAREKYKGISWVVLGEDVEDSAHLIKNKNLKFLKDPKDGVGLIKLLEGLFFSPVGPDSGKSTGGASSPLDVNFINPIVAAVSKVVEQMGKIKVTRGQPFVKNGKSPFKATGDLAGIIALNSSRFTGSLAVVFEEKLICKIFSSMMGKTVTKIDDDVKDSVGELTNIIFGHAKRDLNEIGHTLDPAIPSIISGREIEVRHSVEGVCIVIPFDSSDGKILIETVMKARS